MSETPIPCETDDACRSDEPKAPRGLFARTGVSRELFLTGLGWGVFLAVNVYFFWGVPLPLSPHTGLADYDRLVEPFRLGANGFIFVVVLGVAGFSLVSKITSRHSLWFFCSAAVLFVCGYLLFIWASAISPSVSFFSVAGLLLGASNGLFFLLWGEVLAFFDLASNIKILFLASVFSGSCSAILFLLPPVISYTILGMLIPVAAVMLHRSLSLVHRKNVQYPCRQLRVLVSSIWRPLLCVTMLAFVFNALREMAFADFGGPSLVNIISLAGLVAVSLVILFAAKRLPVKPLDIERIYAPTVLVLAAGLALIPFFDYTWRIVLTAVASCIYLVVVTLFKATCAHQSAAHAIHPFAVFGVGYGGVFIFTALGSLAGFFPRSSGSDNYFVSVIAISLIAVYLLSIPLVVLRKRQRGSSVIVPMGESELSVCCSALAQRFAISQSEQAVMELLSRSMTYASIAQKLQLSENTVRSHAKAIYRKLDIHTKQELVDMVAAERKEGEA